MKNEKVVNNWSFLRPGRTDRQNGAKQIVIPEECSRNLHPVKNERGGDPRVLAGRATSGMTIHNNTAFTLTELLVVVLIIGILAAVAAAQYQKVILKSYMSNLQTMVRGMNPSLAVYKMENNAWPDSFEEIDLAPDGRLLSDKILTIGKNTVCNLWMGQVACFYPASQPHKSYISINNNSNPPVWKCCWGGENNVIKSVCLQLFPSGEYMENAPQYGFIGEQCIVTPY